MKTTKELEDAVRQCQNGNTDSVRCLGDLFYFIKDGDDEWTYFTYSG